MKIGNTELKHGLCLAPMAGFTDRAFRLICHELGAEYAVTEMVSAKAVVYDDKKTYALARIREDEGPVALQIFGSEPEVMAEAAKKLSAPREGVAPAAIDINMGCPVKKIFSNGEGSALMRNPNLIYRITKSVKNATHLPTTVKIRKGISRDAVNAVECALAAEEAGAACICVHGRTTQDMYSGSADREIIAAVKEAVRVPVIANGDILCARDAINMLRETGADGIAIGRGAVGNPYVFAEIAAALDQKLYTPPTLREKAATALRQLALAIEDKGERAAVPESRKQIALYLHSFPGAAQLRAEINAALTYAEVERILTAALQSEQSTH